jgi:hypothetical protein
MTARPSVSLPPTFIKGSRLSGLSEVSEEAAKRGLRKGSHDPLTGHPTEKFYDFLMTFLGEGNPLGQIARSIKRDPCAMGESFVELDNHLRDDHDAGDEAHTALTEVLNQYIDMWENSKHIPLHIGCDICNPTKFAPRPPIIGAAQDAGLPVTHNQMTYCWNDVPGSPTQGHFNGNRVPSMKLYPENDTFYCHQCHIWGFSDQIATRSWQGRT